MNRPFNLIATFSIVGLLAIILFTVSLSWFLEVHLEKQLLERDELLVASIVQVETQEYLGGNPFEKAYNDLHIRNEILHAVFTIPDTAALDMIEITGRVAWSTTSSNIGKNDQTDSFNQSLSGKTGVDYIKTDGINSFGDKNLDRPTVLYVPIIYKQEVRGIFKLHRSNKQLQQQHRILKNRVRLYCSLFGGGLYILLLGIVFPADRILRKQYNGLQKNSDDLKKVNDELNQTQQQLIQKERLSTIGEVCGAVAHGLKNPIASVRSAVQLLTARSLSTDEQHEILDDILQEVDRLTRRLNDLLNFIRPFNIDLQYVQMQNILHNAIRDIHWKAMEEHIKLQVEVPEELESIQVDASLIEEAILIVLSNAMDASRAGDIITCKIELKKDQQIIVIQDKGEGIDEDSQELIFEQFYTTRSKGIGLGLPLCKKIIELHHGQVTIESKHNQGATVSIILPTRVPKRKSIHATT